MERVSFINGMGQSINLEYGAPQRALLSITGLSALDIVPVTKKGYGQNGETLEAVQVGPRTLRLSFSLKAASPDLLYQMRDEVTAIFSPLTGTGRLSYENDWAKRVIDVAVTIAPTETDVRGLYRIFEAELTAYDPLWRDPAETGVRIQDFVGGLAFPIKFDPAIRFAARGQQKVVNIRGSVAAPARIVFLGGCVNPKVSLDTGEFIRIEADIAEGERIEIDTTYGRRSVDRITADGTRTSVVHLMTDDSTMFELQPGRHTVSFAADSGTPEVLLYWSNRYIGV